MNYEEKYNEALTRASKLRVQNPFDTVSQMMEHVFPELAESEDEKIRKELKHYLEVRRCQTNDDEEYISCNHFLAWLEKQGEQNPADEAEPKFHEGDWVVDNCGYVWKIEGILNQFYILEGVEGGESRPTIEWVNKTFHLWTIKDAKDGDVLADKYGNVGIYQGDKTEVVWYSCCYCGVNKRFYDEGSHEFPCYPAAKEQRDLLFKKMLEAGYEWDAEKKRTKEIEQEDEEYNGEDYGIDSLYHAQRILEKTLGKVEGYQSDDGILEHKCAITAVKKLYKKKPTEWSEEDIRNLENIDSVLFYDKSLPEDTCVRLRNWLQSLKRRIG